jgi:hypothetical protein
MTNDQSPLTAPNGDGKTSSGTGHWLLPTDSWVRALLAPALVFIACCIDRNYQTDLWHHLARGRVIVEEGRILDEDRFSYTVKGKHFQDVNWLSQIAFYRVWQVGGLPLLQIVNALILAGVMGIVVALGRRASGSMLAAGGAGVFAFLGLWQLFLIRPQTFSMLLFVSLYACLEGAEKRRWLLWLAPVHLALWVNLHGAFPLGIVLVGCYGLAAGIDGLRETGWGVLRDRRVWLLGGCLMASILATLVNPYGWHVWEYVRQTSGIAAERKIDEWLPPGLDTLTAKVWAASLVILVILLALPGKRLPTRQIVLLAVFLPLSCGSVRMIAWWLLVSTPILAFLAADRLAKVREIQADAPSLGAGLTCAVLFIAALLSLPWFENWSPYGVMRSTHRVEDDLEQVADRLRSEAKGGRIFTRLEWSEYLTWTLGPDFPIFMDGRIEIYPREVWDDYSRITTGEAGWNELLTSTYHVDFLLVDQGPYHGRLCPLVKESPATWKRAGDLIGPVQLYRRADRKK